MGLSGGLDSCVLLHLLSAVVERKKNPIQACYVQHGIQPQQPEALSQYCQSLGLEFRAYRIQDGWLQHQAAQRGLSLEDLARTERYRRFGHCLRLAKKQNTWAAVVLGHHADDQAENFLMNLGRGAGPGALAGMREWQPGREELLLWRPLLTWSRQDLQQWAQARNIPHWEDPSNFQQDILRNFYRWQVLPQLKRLLPGLLPGIRRSQQHLVLLEDWLRQQRGQLEAQLQVSVNAKGLPQIEWPGDFQSLARPLQVELIFLLFDRLRCGEQRRKRLPLSFTLELPRQQAHMGARSRAHIEAHGCRWQFSPQGLLVEILDS